MQDAFRHVSVQSKQQENFTSGNHLRACGCRQKEMLWNCLGWFLPGRIFCLCARLILFLIPVYSFWKWPFLHSVCPFPSGLFTLRVNDVVLISGCFDADGGCSGGEPVAWWAPNVQASLKDAYCFWQVMRLLRLKRSEKAWLTGAVLVDWFQGVCGSMWELPRPNHSVLENSLLGCFDVADNLGSTGSGRDQRWRSCFFF